MDWEKDNRYYEYNEMKYELILGDIFEPENQQKDQKNYFEECLMNHETSSTFANSTGLEYFYLNFKNKNESEEPQKENQSGIETITEIDNLTETEKIRRRMAKLGISSRLLTPTLHRQKRNRREKKLTAEEKAEINKLQRQTNSDSLKKKLKVHMHQKMLKDGNYLISKHLSGYKKKLIQINQKVLQKKMKIPFNKDLIQNYKLFNFFYGDETKGKGKDKYHNRKIIVEVTQDEAIREFFDQNYKDYIEDFIKNHLEEELKKVNKEIRKKKIQTICWFMNNRA